MENNNDIVDLALLHAIANNQRTTDMRLAIRAFLASVSSHPDTPRDIALAAVTMFNFTGNGKSN